MKIILVALILILILAACVPMEEVGASNPTEGGHNMKMVASNEDIEVWKLMDGLTACYITINHHSYESAGIWCK